MGPSKEDAYIVFRVWYLEKHGDAPPLEIAQAYERWWQGEEIE